MDIKVNRKPAPPIDNIILTVSVSEFRMLREAAKDYDYQLFCKLDKVDLGNEE